MLPTIDVILIEMIQRHRLEMSKPADPQENDSAPDETINDSSDKNSGDMPICIVTPGKQESTQLKLSPEQLDTQELDWCKMFYLAPCFGSSIGCVGTSTATLPNVIIYAFVEQWEAFVIFFETLNVHLLSDAMVTTPVCPMSRGWSLVCLKSWSTCFSFGWFWWLALWDSSIFSIFWRDNSLIMKF